MFGANKWRNDVKRNKVKSMKCEVKGPAIHTIASGPILFL